MSVIAQPPVTPAAPDPGKAPVTEQDRARAKEAGRGRDIGEVSQARLILRRFRRSKLAVTGGVVLLVMYLCALFAHFLSPNHYDEIDSNYQNAAPTSFTWDGGPAICGSTQRLNEEAFSWEYTVDCNKAVPLHFFGKGYRYKLFGLIPTERHIVTVGAQPAPATDPEEDLLGGGGDGEQAATAKLYLWGADTQGRDVFARTLHGTRISLTVGLVGVLISTVLAAVIGTVSGYFGGFVDSAIQRVIEVILSIPTLPLWATMAAVLPQDLSVVDRYFFITLILSLVVWTNVARQVRGKVMGYAAADYVAAARAAGSGHTRIIFTHMVPNSASHIVVVGMLAVPATIIAETSLSFLGIGMLPPAVSWGVLLQDAQKIQVVSTYPWLLIPALAVILAVTSFQLLGDGVRDAVDPYG